MEHWAKTLEIKDAARRVRQAEGGRAVLEGLGDLSAPVVVQVAGKVEGANPAGQDRAAILPFRDGYLLVVVDGTGGTSGGAEAAQFVVDALRTLPDRDLDWAEVLRELDLTLTVERSCGETTTVIAFVQEAHIAGASVGDSGAWLIVDDEIVDLTEHQQRKPLLGSGRAVPVAFRPRSFRGRLVLGSDGLFKYAEAHVIAKLAGVSPVAAAAAALIQATRLQNGALRDDVAVIVAG